MNLNGPCAKFKGQLVKIKDIPLHRPFQYPGLHFNPVVKRIGTGNEFQMIFPDTFQFKIGESEESEIRILTFQMEEGKGLFL